VSNHAKQAAAQAEAWRLLGDRLNLLTQSDADKLVVGRFAGRRDNLSLCNPLD
jgi:hypothetical protein